MINQSKLFSNYNKELLTLKVVNWTKLRPLKRVTLYEIRTQRSMQAPHPSTGDLFTMQIDSKPKKKKKVYDLKHTCYSCIKYKTESNWILSTI